MEYISAEKARLMSFENQKDSPSPLMKSFFDFVQTETAQGNLEGNFYTAGEHFSSSEYEFISGTLNYKLIWNSACLWYEVSW